MKKWSSNLTELRKDIHQKMLRTMSEEDVQNYETLWKNIYYNKLLFANSREDSSTRLFINQMNSRGNEIYKDGWWRTFTISLKPCNKGLYVCRIIACNLDKDGYLNFIVWPMFSIPEDSADKYGATIDLLTMGNFISDYSMCHSDELNIDAFEEWYGEKFDSNLRAHDAAFDMISWRSINDDLDENEEEGTKRGTSCEKLMKEINTILLSEPKKTELELLAIDVDDRLENFYKEKYPNFYAMVKSQDFYYHGCTHSNICLQRLIGLIDVQKSQYIRLIRDEKISEKAEEILHMCELSSAYDIKERDRLRKYYDEVHAKQKAAKTAAKKAKKAAEKARKAVEKAAKENKDGN